MPHSRKPFISIFFYVKTNEQGLSAHKMHLIKKSVVCDLQQEISDVWIEFSVNQGVDMWWPQYVVGSP